MYSQRGKAGYEGKGQEISEGNCGYGCGTVNSPKNNQKKISTSCGKYLKMILNEIYFSKVTKDKISYNSPS